MAIPEAARGDFEIGESFLVAGVDLSQHNGLGIVPSEDGAAEKAPIGGLVKAAEKCAAGRDSRWKTSR